MANQRFANNFRTTLSQTFGINDTTLNLVVDTQLAKLPVLGTGEFFTLTIFRQDGIVESGWEVLKCTSRTAGAITVQRQYEGAAKSQFLVAGTYVEARVTTKAMEQWVMKTDIGSAALVDIATGHDATYLEAVRGDDTRLSNARPPTAHTHDWTDITLSGVGSGSENLNNMIIVGGTGNTLQSIHQEDLFGSRLDKSPVAPNTAIPVSYIMAYSGETNLDFAVIPKGTGALLAQVPDSAINGGNKRGSNAVDFQRLRTAANMVASGNFAAILSGQNNLASAQFASVLSGDSNSNVGQYTVIAGGYQNDVPGTASYGAIGGGYQNRVGGQYSSVSGGGGNQALGQGASIQGGVNNRADGNLSAVMGGWYNRLRANYSSALGGINADDRGIIGAQVWGGAVSAIGGTLQRAKYLLSCLNTGSALVQATTDGATAGANNILVIPPNSSWAVEITAICRNMTSGGSASYNLGAIATVIRGASVDSVNMSAAVMNLRTSTGTNPNPSNAPQVTADQTTGSLKITTTGSVGINYQWVIEVSVLQINSAP